MFNRKELKEKAKTVLKRCYWKAFVVAVIIDFANSIMDKVKFTFSDTDIETTFEGLTESLNNGIDLSTIDFSRYVPSLFHAVLIGVLTSVIVIALKVFIGNPFIIGGAKFFTEAESGNDNLNSVTCGFASGNYMKNVLTMFLRNLYVLLWSLLFIIPGIVKYYAYSMVPYIIADNPSLSTDEVLKISNILTKNKKWKIFVLDLSFLGWFILGVFCFGIGTYFVLPYYYATKAELYINLRNKAIADALYHPEDFSVETPRISPNDEEANGEN